MTTTQKTMLVLADSFPNASETFITDHARLVGGRGWHVLLLVRALNRGHASAAGALGPNVAVARLPGFHPAALLQAVRWVARRPWAWRNPMAWRCAFHGAALARCAAADLPWDVVHAHYGNNAVAALIARPWWRDRLVANFHGHDATSAPYRHGWMLYRRVLDSVIAVAHSSFIERRLRDGTAMDVRRVTMGVDLSRFAGTPGHREWPSTIELLTVGRLTRQKGQAQAIEALGLLQRRNAAVRFRLTLVGDGPERKHLQASAARLGLSGSVTFAGARSYDEMASLYPAFHVMLLPAQRTRDGQQEAFSRAAIEAMACGIPVIGCPVGGLPDTIGTGGIVASGFGPSEIADATEQLLALRDPGQWAAMARTRAMAFPIEAMERDYMAIADAASRHTGATRAG